MLSEEWEGPSSGSQAEGRPNEGFRKAILTVWGRWSGSVKDGSEEACEIAVAAIVGGRDGFQAAVVPVGMEKTLI